MHEYKELEDLYYRLKNQAMSTYNTNSGNSLGDLLDAFKTDRNIPIADGLEMTLAHELYQGIPEYFFNDKIRKAREFAEIVHGDQKYDVHAYPKHLADVYKVFLEWIIEPVYGKEDHTKKAGLIDKYQDIACAMWLHDTVEDTSTTRDEIEEHFGTDVADMVFAVSGVGKDRAERLDSIARKIEETPDAIIIKLCDRIANTRYSSQQHFAETGKGLFQMYVKEYPEFKKALGGTYAEIGFIKRMWEYLESITKE